MKTPTLTLAIAMIAVFSPYAVADFYAIGPLEGTVCSGLVIKSCKVHVLSAVKGDDGALHEIARSFPSVDEHRGDICIIKTRNTTGSIIGAAINAIKQPDFYGKDDSGKLVSLDVDYVSFKFRER